MPRDSAPSDDGEHLGNDVIRTGGGLVVPGNAVEWRFDRGGGPGGQHRNKVHTRATITVDLQHLQGPATVVDRVRGRLGTSVTLTENSSRSQWRNRARLVERVSELLEDAAREERPRRTTRPTRGSVAERLSTKRERSRSKQLRGRVRRDDS